MKCEFLEKMADYSTDGGFSERREMTEEQIERIKSLVCCEIDSEHIERLRLNLNKIDLDSKNSGSNHLESFIYLHQCVAYFLRFSGECVVSVKFEDVNRSRLISVQHLINRIAIETNHAFYLCSSDPWWAAPTVAAINRLVFEGSVNLLYVIGEEGEKRANEMLYDALKKESKHNVAIREWEDSEDKCISSAAKTLGKAPDRTEVADVTAVAEKFNIKDRFRYPSIQQRCQDNGDDWSFLYDWIYRGLSSWTHADPTRAIIDPAILVDGDELGMNKAIFESWNQIGWCAEIVSQLSISLAEATNHGDKLDELKVKRQSMRSCFHNLLIKA